MGSSGKALTVMKNTESRRFFLKSGAITAAVLATGKLHAAAEDQIPVKEIEQQTEFLWADNSMNNGTDLLKRPKMELFKPKSGSSKKRAAILVLPGGAYRGLASHEGAPIAKLFAANGIVGAVLTYRVAPNAFPAPVADALRAIRLLRSKADELGIDPERIGVIGFSAGGHLASVIATQPDVHLDAEDDLVAKFSARPNKLMLAYPVISFMQYVNQGSLNNFLGKDKAIERCKQFSSELQVTSLTPPSFLFHTASDPGVRVQNSLFFAQACIEHKVPVALHIYPNGGHGVGLAFNDPELKGWSEVLLKWLGNWCETA
jgi:acetyl esterase/lipase